MHNLHRLSPYLHHPKSHSWQGSPTTRRRVGQARDHFTRAACGTRGTANIPPPLPLPRWHPPTYAPLLPGAPRLRNPSNETPPRGNESHRNPYLSRTLASWPGQLTAPVSRSSSGWQSNDAGRNRICYLRRCTNGCSVSHALSAVFGKCCFSPSSAFEI